MRGKKGLWGRPGSGGCFIWHEPDGRCDHGKYIVLGYSRPIPSTSSSFYASSSVSGIAIFLSEYYQACFFEVTQTAYHIGEPHSENCYIE
jgi:hypothetical protein